MRWPWHSRSWQRPRRLSIPRLRLPHSTYSNWSPFSAHLRPGSEWPPPRRWSLGPAAAPALPALTAALKDPDRNVRGACLCTIGAIGKAALPAAQSLRSFLSDQDPATRLAAAGALGNLGPAARGFTTDLLKAATDQDADVRAVALQSLGMVRCDPLQAASVLERGMKDKLPRVQMAALDTAAGLGAASTLQSASGLIGNERESVHTAALEAVARLQDRDPPGGFWPPNVWLATPPPSPPAPDPFAPRGGERVWKPPTYIPPVTSFPDLPPDPANPEHRGKTLTQWIQQLSSPDAEARWQACQALGEMGWRARLAIPALAAAREDREVKVRHEAIVALEKIRGRMALPPSQEKPPKPETPTVTQPPKPGAAVAEGFMYFVYPCQVMTVEGPEQRREPVEAKEFEGLRLRMVNVLSLKQKKAALRKEGNKDPIAELNRLLAAEDASLVLECQEDYLIRATCKGQDRFVNGHDGRAFGVIGSYGLSGGNWHVEVTCVMRSGLRIDTAGKISFGIGSRSKGADQMMVARSFKQADRQYGEMIETLRELGLDERAPVFRELIYKQQMAREGLAAERYLNLFRQTSGKVNAGISVPFEAADLTALEQAKNLQFAALTKKPTGPYMVTRPGATPEAPAEHWIFRPDAPGEEFRNQSELATAGLAELVKRPAPAAARITLILDGVPTDGVLSRRIEGVKLIDALKQYPGLRSAVKQDIAADYAFSAWAGDYDRNDENFIVGTEGTPAFDRDLANPGELQYHICHKELGLPLDGLPVEPARTREVVDLMEKRLGFAQEHADHPLYGSMVQIERQMTFKDMENTVGVIEKLTPEQIMEKLRPVYGEDADEVLQVLLIRQKHLREVLSKQYSMPSLPKPQAWLPIAPAAA